MISQNKYNKENEILLIADTNRKIRMIFDN